MKVRELITALEKMPSEAEVLHLWDGEPRTAIEFCWLSLRGDVITSDYGQRCYTGDARPFDAPTEEADPYWLTPNQGDGKSHVLK